MYQGSEPMCIGVESDSQSSRPSASKMPAPRSSDSRMIDEYDIRKSTPGHLLGDRVEGAAEDPERDRVDLDALPARRPGLAPDFVLDDAHLDTSAAVTASASEATPVPITMFPKRSTCAVSPGGITVVESYWLTIAGPSSRFPALSAVRS